MKKSLSNWYVLYICMKAHVMPSLPSSALPLLVFFLFSPVYIMESPTMGMKCMGDGTNTHSSITFAELVARCEVTARRTNEARPVDPAPLQDELYEVQS